MKDPQKPRKSRQTLVEGVNNVPHLLEKARQAVDEVTQTAPGPPGEAKPVKPGKAKTAPPKKPVKGPARRKKTSPPAAAPEKPATAAATAAPESPIEPLWGLADYGITVKHAIPGRIRLRLGRMLYNETMAAKLPALLATVPGVTAAEASTSTGSLLIIFDSGELARDKSRQDLAGVIHQFFPGLDTETLVNRMLQA